MDKLRFIRLSSLVINPRYIETITIEPDKFVIRYSQKGLSGYFILGGGAIDTYNWNLEICKTKHNEDYQRIKKWIGYEEIDLSIKESTDNPDEGKMM
jgi:hypothetical protein